MGEIDSRPGVPPSGTNRKTLLILVGVLVGIVVLASVVGHVRGGDDSASSSATSTTTSRYRPPLATASRTVAAPPPTVTPQLEDDRFIAALSKMRGWPDRAQVIATSRDELIEMGRDACAMQEQSGEGSISTSAWVEDVYEIPGDEAGAIVVAAFEVYCPEHA